MRRITMRLCGLLLTVPTLCYADDTVDYVEVPQEQIFEALEKCAEAAKVWTVLVESVRPHLCISQARKTSERWSMNTTQSVDALVSSMAVRIAERARDASGDENCRTIYGSIIDTGKAAFAESVANANDHGGVDVTTASKLAWQCAVDDALLGSIAEFGVSGSIAESEVSNDREKKPEHPGRIIARSIHTLIGTLIEIEW